jgi:hypothetical protein
MRKPQSEAAKARRNPAPATGMTTDASTLDTSSMNVAVPKTADIATTTTTTTTSRFDAPLAGTNPAIPAREKPIEAASQSIHRTVNPAAMLSAATATIPAATITPRYSRI